MNGIKAEQALSERQIATVLYRCHEDLMKVYQSQVLPMEDLRELSELAKITADLVKVGIEKAKVSQASNATGAL